MSVPVMRQHVDILRELNASPTAIASAEQAIVAEAKHTANLRLVPGLRCEYEYVDRSPPRLCPRPARPVIVDKGIDWVFVVLALGYVAIFAGVMYGC